MTYDTKVSIAVLGEMGVGKSSLLLRFAKNIFQEHLASTIIDCYHTDIHVRDKRVRLEMWDTAGQERFKCIIKNYFRNADGVLLVYDVTDISSFHKLTSWFLKLKLENEAAVAIIVGNKTDDLKGGSVTVTSVKAFAKEQDLVYYECSAKTGENVTKIFKDLTERVLVSKEVIPLNKPEAIPQEIQRTQNFSRVPGDLKKSLESPREEEMANLNSALTKAPLPNLITREPEPYITREPEPYITMPPKPCLSKPLKACLNRAPIQPSSKESVVLLHNPSPAKKKKCCSL